MNLSKIIKKNNIFVIAEAGSNHEGDINVALEMIREAKMANADAIKFQAFTRELLFADDEYCKTLNIADDALDSIHAITFKREWYPIIMEECKKNKIMFLSTPFSVEAINDMEKYDVEMYKIASCDSNNIPLLKRIAITKKSVILSTGLATNKEIKEALKILKHNEVALLHCCVEYPAPFEDINLNRIGVMSHLFKKNIIGYSDHTIGSDAAIVAVSKGAKIIEKHFTMTPEKKEGDHIISLDRKNFKNMIESINNTISMLGIKNKTEKIFTKNEKKELIFAKRSIYLRNDMEAGCIINESDMIALRPNTGISVSKWEKIIGKKLRVDKKAFEKLSERDFN